MKWTQCELGDIVALKSGGTPSKSNPELWGGDIPWVSTKELKSGRLYTTESRVTDKAIKNKKQLVEPGTVLIAVRGMVLAKAFPVTVAMRNMIFNQDIKAVIPKDGLLGRYLPYLLRGHHDELRALADEAAHGTKRIQSDRLLSFPVGLPPVSTQSCITDILSAYDDLIENNKRRIEILEEMARRLYEEWFVHFRFPGHEEVSFKESELGEIPEGWEVCRLEDLVALNPRTKVPKDGEKWFVPMGALSESSMIVGSLEKKSGNSGAKFQNGDTLVARITPCLENGKTGFVDFLHEDQPTACGSTEFIVLRSISLCPEMVYLLARSDRFRDVAIKSMSGATGRQRVRVESLLEFPVVQPDNSTLEAFQQFVAPCFKQARTLAKKNSNLLAQRDLLLPKLVSGEIDVSDIPMPDDKEVEAA